MLQVVELTSTDFRGLMNYIQLSNARSWWYVCVEICLLYNFLCAQLKALGSDKAGEMLVFGSNSKPSFTGRGTAAGLELVMDKRVEGTRFFRRGWPYLCDSFLQCVR